VTREKEERVQREKIGKQGDERKTLRTGNGEEKKNEREIQINHNGKRNDERYREKKSRKRYIQ